MTSRRPNLSSHNRGRSCFMHWVSLTNSILKRNHLVFCFGGVSKRVYFSDRNIIGDALRKQHLGCSDEALCHSVMNKKNKMYSQRKWTNQSRLNNQIKRWGDWLVFIFSPKQPSIYLPSEYFGSCCLGGPTGWMRARKLSFFHFRICFLSCQIVPNGPVPLAVTCALIIFDGCVLELSSFSFWPISSLITKSESTTGQNVAPIFLIEKLSWLNSFNFGDFKK